MTHRTVIRAVILFLLLCPFLWTEANAQIIKPEPQSCERIVRGLNQQLSPKINELELIDILHILNYSNNRKLPIKFVKKQDARLRGWKPGKDLWSVSIFRGASIGGDQFYNREGRLPDKKWREADLDYKGGHRGGKRLVFSLDGDRRVTVDHYKTFIEVPKCR